MAGDNSEQVAEWNGPVGQRWAAEQATFDNLTRPFGDAALKAAAARPGERVIDIGCGCGDTSLELGRAVGASGSVLGVDISAPMLDVARRRAKADGPGNVTFEQADASTAPLFPDRDLLFSRFGVMFFAAPVPAFAHLRRALRDSGRLAFVCWQGPRENPWAIVPVMAARAVLELEGAPGDPFAPGPFAFGDPDRVRAILLEANFRDVDAEPFEYPMPLGDNPRHAAEQSTRLGPVSRLVREMGEEHLPLISEAVEKALEQFAAEDGSVALPGRSWIVTAKAG
ncbi:MAG TPA: methyltransferase domain-containing protein [Hyphomonadaceae bacterium]|nr:methyltransferase domain-containing protein [Hyphomonadaceae bacterium]